jgi:signal transduction histidine kinase
MTRPRGISAAALRARRTVTRLGITVALAAAVATPSVFFLTEIAAVSDRLELKALTAATRVAQHAYASDEMWRYQLHLLDDLTSPLETTREPVERLVLGPDGKVIGRFGALVLEPRMARQSPIVVRDKTIGVVEMRTSLVDLLLGTLATGFLGALIGTAAYFGVRSYPLRVIDRALAELQDSQDRLANQVEETKYTYGELEAQNRRLEEAFTELGRARDEAERANRAKSEFLTNMSHELRTPLNAVIGFSDLMVEEALGKLGHAGYHEYARDIHASGLHLLDLINEILDLSKIETGTMEIAAEIVNFDEVVQLCLRLVRERAECAKVHVTLTPDCQADLHVYGDRVRLKQVVLNILSNAIKFTPAGGHVSVSLRKADDGAIILSIRDTGIGMREDDIPRALQPFQQLDNSLSRKYEGTGLGLPITKLLVELHGGCLKIDSAPGAGTTVTIQFPPPPKGACSPVATAAIRA